MTTQTPSTAPPIPARTEINQRFNQPWWLPLLPLAAGTFILGIDGLILAGLLPQVSADLEVSPSQAGQLTTLFALTYAITSPVIAALTASFDRRLLLRGGMLVFITGLALQAAGPTFAFVAAGRVVAALGAAAFQANAFMIAGTLFDDAKRPKALAVVAGGASLALVAGLPFGVTIGQAFGWRNAIWMLAALAVAPALLVRILPPVHTPTTNLGDRLRTLADRTVLTILAGTVAALMTGFLVVAYVPVIVGISGTTVVVAMLSFGSGQVLGTTTVPALINRVGSRGTLTISAALATTAAICLLLRLGGEPLQILALFGIGLSLGTGMVPQQNRLFSLVPTKAAVAMGLNGSAIYVSSAAGAAIGGAALGWGGEPTLTLSAVLVATLALATAILLRPERVAPAAP